MEDSIIVVFYSKYSKRCTKFFEKINNLIEFRKICVDHPDIRSTILSEQDKYYIRIVPSIIIFFSNGVMQKYEDLKAFEWADNLIHKMTSKQISFNKEFVALKSIIDQESLNNNELSNNSSNNSSINLSNNNFSNNSSNNSSNTFSNNSSNNLSNNSSNNSSNNLSNNLSNKDSINESSNKDTEYLGMKRRIETTPLIQKSNNFDNLMDNNRNEKKINDKRHESIKNLAQQLQAEREKEDEQLNPNALSKISE